jgi:hypothetical protein
MRMKKMEELLIPFIEGRPIEHTLHVGFELGPGKLVQ